MKQQELIPALRFKEFSGEWEKNKVGELCDCIVPGRNKPKEFGGGIAWITTPDISHSGYIFNSKSGLGITKEEAKNVGSKIVPKDAVIISCVGDLGLVAIAGIELVINQQLHAFLPSEDIDHRFLMYCITTQSKHIDRVATKTAVPYMNKDNCNSIPIIRPTLPEQQKIASFLTAVDTKIQQLNEKKELLAQYKKGVMQQLFSRELRFKRDDGGDFEDWEEKKLGEVVTLMQSGISRKLSDRDIGLPILRSNNLQEGRLDVTDIKYWFEIDDKGANLENYVLQEGDMLVNFINSLAQIGKVAMFTDLLNRKTIYTTNLMRLRFSDVVSSSFMFNYFHLKKYENFIQSITKPAVNQASFTTKEFKTFRISLPSLPEQQKIASYLSALDAKIALVQEKVEETQVFKKGLLQGMFV